MLIIREMYIENSNQSPVLFRCLADTQEQLIEKVLDKIGGTWDNLTYNEFESNRFDVMVKNQKHSFYVEQTFELDKGIK